MCGFTIKLLDQFCQEDRIAHRGIKKTQKDLGLYTMTHFKLPFQTDLEDQFDQPIKLKNGDYLLYNGEIFNYPPQFKNDVEYLVDYFSDEDWKNKLNDGFEYQSWDGFWAIAIVSQKGFWAFTDPLGKKQLYWSNGCLSSEIKPLLRTNDLDPSFNMVDPERSAKTPFKDVFRLQPNTLYKSNGFCAIQIKNNLFDLHRGGYSMAIKKELERSVESRLINRHGGATLLISGGLDSSIILEIMHRKNLLDQIELLTIDNQEDSKYIDILQDRFDVEVRKIESKTSSVNTILKAYESPIEKGSLFPQWLLCKESKNNVIITGDGADELFSGYNRAQINDTQDFDVFTELPYYHNLRLDRIGMAFTKEIRSPFMSHDLIRMALRCPYDLRKGKKILKDLFGSNLPAEILDRKKEPLRIKDRVENKDEYQKFILKQFNNTNFL